jgi:mannosyltransferase
MKRGSSVRWFVVVIVLSGFFMLVWGLDSKSLWWDEIFSLKVASYPPAETVAAVAADIHPPLYFVLLGLWIKFAGTSEFALRLPSVFAAVAGLCLTWQLGKRMVGNRAANASIVFLAFSPLFIEFSRMARYYSLVLSLGVLATWLFVGALQRDRWYKWLSYAAVCALSLYTFYLSFALVLAHGLSLLLHQGVNRVQLVKWFASALAAGILFAPFLAILSRQVVSAGQGSADFSKSVTGGFIAAFYSVYGFAVGETIFPWIPVAVPAVLVVAGLGVLGAYRLRGQSRILLLTALILPLLVMILTVVSVSTGTPFLNVPVRGLFILPYLALLFGFGFQSLPRSGWRIGAAIIIGMAWALALYNGYTGRQFLNPTYIIPARQVAEQIAADAGPNDVVIGEWDSGFTYYFEPAREETPYFEASAPGPALDYLESHTVRRVWLVTIGRDGTRSRTPTQLMQWLEENDVLVREQGYGEQDATYRKVKETLLHRPAYLYKLLVQEYEPKAH